MKCVCFGGPAAPAAPENRGATVDLDAVSNEEAGTRTPLSAGEVELEPEPQEKSIVNEGEELSAAAGTSLEAGAEEAPAAPGEEAAGSAEASGGSEAEGAISSWRPAELLRLWLLKACCADGSTLAANTDEGEEQRSGSEDVSGPPAGGSCALSPAADRAGTLALTTVPAMAGA
eukprot:TRINITY_DN60885_c0_g1_i1.p2 TRINITY_DN60885_c0_g1~~TRINITY_DN60885_c0_g1_i1.p2  ORF type:complete len:174 (-),score=51.97 TRINITY_DN60885_c0_g1_i1:23-544(-)